MQETSLVGKSARIAFPKSWRRGAADEGGDRRSATAGLVVGPLADVRSHDLMMEEFMPNTMIFHQKKQRDGVLEPQRAREMIRPRRALNSSHE